ncbi:MAG: hypothetical protein JWR20_2228 [Marmoricola sp.]|nr:hypothetical protein [Marmoricola sp.]
MLITNHVLSGALVGLAAPGPLSGFVLGVASHFALDSVPHWGDLDRFLQVAVPDGLTGLTAMAHVAAVTSREAPGRRTTVVASMLGACLPDADKPSTLFLGRSPFPARIDDWHRAIQRESVRRLPQEFVVAGVGLLAFRLLVASRGAPRIS